MPEEIEGKKTDVKKEKFGDMPATSSEIPEASSSHKKKKKSKKHKHETDVVAAKILEEVGVNSAKDGNGIPTAVSDQKIVDIPPTSNEVREESSRKKKKKSRKDEHQIPEEAEGKKTDANAVEGVNDTHMAVNDENIGQMPAIGSEIPGDLSNRKRNKKSKKNKHETDVAEKMLEEPQGEKADVNSVKYGNGVPTAVSDGKIVDTPPTSNEVPEESSHKKKKSRNDEHQIPEEAEGKKTDANAVEGVNDTHMAVNDEKIGQMPASSSEILGDLSNRKTNKKSKKNKHEPEVVADKILEEAQGKKANVNSVKDGNGIPTAVSDKKVVDTRPTSNEIPEESSHKKKKKSRKDKNQIPEEAEGKKTDTNAVEGVNDTHMAVNDEKIEQMPASSSEIPGNLSNRKRNKKSKKNKHETDVAEKMLEEPQGKKADVNSVKHGNGIPTAVSDEKIVDIPPTSNEVPEESSHKKKKKSRKDEHQIPEEAEGKRTDANAVEGVNDTHMAVNDEKIGQMPASSREISGDLSNRKRNKKSKKNKHETDVVAEKILEEPQGKKADVNSVKDGNSIPSAVSDEKTVDIPPTSNEVPEESSHKKKKSRKHEHQIPEEAEGKTTDANAVEGVNDTHMAVNDEKTGQMPASSSGISGDLSNRKRNKKSKKSKHETDLLTETMPAEAKTKKTDVNVAQDGNDIHTAVIDKKITDMPAASSDVLEEQICRQTKLNSKNDKHEMPERAVVKDGAVDPGESNSHKKKELKKHKHESDLLTEEGKMLEEGKKIDVNAVKDGNSIHTTANDEKVCNDEKTKIKDKRSDMSESCVDVFPVPDCPSTSERAKKRKHGIDEEREAEGEKLEVCVGVKNKKNSLVLTGSDEGTEESSSYEKIKKAKKYKRENDLPAEKLLEVTKGRKRDTNMSGDTDGIGESGTRTESKEARKQNSDTGIPDEKGTEGTEREVKEIDTVVKDKGAAVPTDDNEVTGESSSHRKKKKAKKRKQESEFTDKKQESNDGKKEDKNNTVVQEICAEASQESSSHTKCKVATKRKHESEKMVEEQKGEKTEKSEDMPACSSDVAGESSGHKKKKKVKKHKHERGLEEKGNSVLESDYYCV